MRIEVERFDAMSAFIGEPVERIVLHNTNGLSVELMTYGALMLAINAPDKNGVVENVLLSYDHLEDYVSNPMYMGATIGPNAGRIADGKLQIRDDVYSLEINEGISNLHGGRKGFHTKIWTMMGEQVGTDRCSVTLVLDHEHLEDGFPGNITVKAVFTLYDDGRLTVLYTAISDRACHLNMANHNYYNLSGNEKTKISEHLLMLRTKGFYEVDAHNLPIFDLISQECSEFDFGNRALLAKAIGGDHGGIDHPFVLEEDRFSDTPQVVYEDPVSGRRLEITTDQPCAVIYTNNISYKHHMGICFEMQQVPNQVNLIEGGEPYINETTYRFSVVSS